MRVRSLVLPAAVALAAVVVVPSSASAAAQCGLVLPTKVVVNAVTVDTDIALTSGCIANDADHAYWNYEHTSSGFGGPMNFESADIAAGPALGAYLPWDDDQPMGNYYLTPVECKTAGGTDLTQNSAVTKVKYASKITATVTRTSTKLSWAATATQWSGKSHRNVVRPRVFVGLFHQTSSSASWTFVSTRQTSDTGKVAFTVTSPKAGNYRLVIAETPTVWAAYSSTIKGRI